MFKHVGIIRVVFSFHAIICINLELPSLSVFNLEGNDMTDFLLGVGSGAKLAAVLGVMVGADDSASLCT